MTLRLPPFVLAVPLLALAAFGVVRSEPWQPTAPAPGPERTAMGRAGDPARSDRSGESPSDDTLVEPSTDVPGDTDPTSPIEPPLEALADTTPEPEALAPPQVELATARREQSLDDAERRAAAQLELERAREQVEVVVYYAPWCGYCTKARAYLAQRGIRNVEHDVDSDASASGRHRRLNPRGSVPTIDIDGHVLVGFNARSIERALDRAARARLSRESGS